MKRPRFFDLGVERGLPHRILEIRKKLKWISMIGRVDLSRSLVPHGREETAWMKRLRAAEEERRCELER